MKRRFNITGACNPQKHYMVRLDNLLKKIKEDYIDEGSYFVINKGRQYGKTTMLRALTEYLEADYIVLFLDFQKISAQKFTDEHMFTKAFTDKLLQSLRSVEVEVKHKLQESLEDFKKNYSDAGLDELFECLSCLCEIGPRPIVLIIDEVDSASNNQVFLDFLAQLRGYYLERDDIPIFQSVILAGVYDIKNLKLKLRPDAEHKYNSPWNIAAKFNVDMSFSADQIASMLEEYETDSHTGMDIRTIAGEIYQYTSGYPYLVSAICKILDEELVGKPGFDSYTDVWTREGVIRAVKIILNEKSALFESMRGHIRDNPEMKRMLYAILFQGEPISYNADNEVIDLAYMFGYIVEKDSCVQIANRIFETRLYNYFLSEEELSSAIGNMAKRDKGCFIHDGRLDMDIVLEKFVQSFTDIYSDNDDKFIEDYGRKFFLLFLKPIINGTGNYYIEAQTRDARRTDVIVDYLGEQFVIELKIWHGNEYNERGERQLADYLDYYHKDKGYMISFNFNKNKMRGIHKVEMGNKTLVEAVV